METIAVVFVVVMALAALVVARMAWRFVHGDVQAEAAGSWGWQFFGRRDKATKPEDWLDK